MPKYMGFSERTPDWQYNDLLVKILREGNRVETQQEEPALMILGYQMRFPFKNGFPLITERDLLSAENPARSIFNQALGELFAFLHGTRTLEELESFGCFFWRRWATKEKCAKRGLEPGDLGPGSYGPSWTNFPTNNGPFNQIQNILEQIREFPHLRTHFISPWIPQYTIRGKGKQQKVVVAPCHGWLHILLDPEKRTLRLHHFQRSADAPVGLPANMIEYGALALMLAQVLGYEAEELVYTLSDVHIYKSQIGIAEEMIKEKHESRRFPKVYLDGTVTDLLDFRQKHFLVEEYYPNEGRRIPTPV